MVRMIVTMTIPDNIVQVLRNTIALSPEKRALVENDTIEQCVDWMISTTTVTAASGKGNNKIGDHVASIFPVME